MRHCHAAQEMVRRSKARRQRQKLQANAVVSEVEAQKDEGCVDLFDVAINTIELEKEVSSCMIDSGASGHVSGDSNVFDSIEGCQGSVTTASGENLTVMGSGTVDLSNNGEIKMQQVLYVPGVSQNLLSVSSIAKYGFILVFDNKQCLIIKDKHKIVGRGLLDKNGLYRFVVENCSLPLYAIHFPSTATLWHRRLGYLNHHSLRFMSVKQLATGIPLIPTCSDICNCCMIGKQSRERRVKQSEHRAGKSLELIHSDLCGIIKPQSLGGAQYFISFTDDYSRYTWLFFMRLKSQALYYFKIFRHAVETRFNKKVLALRSDRGGEYLSSEFDAYLLDAGIHRELTTALTPNQNGVVERKNRTLLEKARAMVADAKTPTFLWAEAIATANYLTNRSPTRANSGLTPYQKLRRKKPNLQHLRIYGSIAWVHVHDERRTKLQPKSKKCVFVGYSEVSKAYRCYDSHARIVLISKDVKFDEGIFPHSPSTCVPTTSEISLKPLSSRSTIIEISDPSQYTIPVASSESVQLPTLPPMDQLPATSGLVEPLSFEFPGSSSVNPADEMVRVYTRRPPGYVPTPVFNSPAPDLRRSTRPRETSSRLREFVTTVTTVDEFINFIHSTDEPLHFRDAASNPLWVQAMTEEMEAISQNQTWILVDPPLGCKPISAKWIYKIKSGPDGSSPRYKARLVARGDM